MPDPASPAGRGGGSARRRNRFLALCLAGWLAAAGACSPEEREAVPAPPVGTEVGQRAPALGGTLATGEAFSLAERAGSPVVIVFYQGAYCGLCRERLARLQEHLSAYRSLGVEVVAAAPDPPPVGAELARQLGLGFPLLSADSISLARWGIAGAGRGDPRPGTFVVGSGGEIVFRHLGRNAGDRASDATLLTVLERLNRD